MRNDDEFTSSRDRQYQTKKSSSRKSNNKQFKDLFKCPLS